MSIPREIFLIGMANTAAVAIFSAAPFWIIGSMVAATTLCTLSAIGRTMKP